MDPRMIPKGGSDQEFTDLENRRNPNPAGVYYHPQAKKFIETGGVKMPDGSISHDQLTGTIQGDAFSQIGFRPASKEELEEYRAQQEETAKRQAKRAKSTTTSLSS